MRRAGSAAWLSLLARLLVVLNERRSADTQRRKWQGATRTRHRLILATPRHRNRWRLPPKGPLRAKWVLRVLPLDSPNENTPNLARKGRLMSPKQYDLTFIGAGISSAYTMIHLLEELRDVPRGEPLRLLVIEKDQEFWTGVPYGRRSGAGALTITSLDDFLPSSETEGFGRWLTLNRRSLVAEFKENGGLLATEWIRNHGADIDRGAYRELYLPRFFFGRYLKERVSVLLTLVEHRKLVKCELRRAEATAVDKITSGFRIHLQTIGRGEELIDTRRMVLATGSPSRQAFTPGYLDHPRTQAGFIQDSHAPGLPETLKQISNAVVGSKDQNPDLSADGTNILVIGANASALELVYSLMGDGNLEANPTIHVLSPSGPPEHWTAMKDSSKSFSPQYLPAATAVLVPTAQKFLMAVAEDVKLARAQGFSLADTIGPISAALVPALDKLSADEQREFVRFHSVEIGRLQRRAGGPYQDAARNMIASGQLRFIRGRFVASRQDESGRLLVDYLDENHRRSTLLTPMNAVVNCAGFQELQPAPSPLIGSLFANDVCAPNSSLRGFEVNERFEASDGAYVMGPLLAGNLNATLRVWHAESCARICGLSQRLAGVLAEDLSMIS